MWFVVVDENIAAIKIDSSTILSNKTLSIFVEAQNVLEMLSKCETANIHSTQMLIVVICESADWSVERCWTIETHERNIDAIAIVLKYTVISVDKQNWIATWFDFQLNLFVTFEALKIAFYF